MLIEDFLKKLNSLKEDLPQEDKKELGVTLAKTHGLMFCVNTVFLNDGAVDINNDGINVRRAYSLEK